MNHVLSLPYTTVTPAQLRLLQADRHETVVTRTGTVRLVHPSGVVEMRFSDASHRLEGGVKVYVWWKGGGFVCAPTDHVEAEARESFRVAEQVAQTRAALAAARQERAVRIAASQFGGLDVSQQEPVSIY